METITTSIETEENENLIKNENLQGISFIKAPSSAHLTVYFICFLIIFLMVALTIQWIFNYNESSEEWIKSVKFNEMNDQYYRHPKY